MRPVGYCYHLRAARIAYDKNGSILQKRVMMRLQDAKHPSASCAIVRVIHVGIHLAKAVIFIFRWSMASTVPWRIRELRDLALECALVACLVL